MDLKELAKNAKDMPDRKIEREFDEFFIKNREKLRFLDESNKSLIMDLIYKYKEKARQGIMVSPETIRRDTHDIWHRRLELGLKENDLDMIRDILSSVVEK
jgi:Txe/YoeB family toxin of Txe-Axe toxin-antitoxin module